MPEASQIRRMFSAVAPRYDLLNHLLSLGIDRRWRSELASSLGLRKTDRVLDICCGTGDLALEIATQARSVACDFTWEMLTRAKDKSHHQATSIHIAAADALCLPFPNECFDAVTVAFGVRNLEDLKLGLSESRRVLRHGGVLAVLEFTRPRSALLRVPYTVYLRGFLPLVGRFISREQGAYRYLADSIAGFPDPEMLCRHLRGVGYSEVDYRLLTGGIVALHTARK